VVAEIVISTLSAGTLGVVVTGLIRLGRILERQDAISDDVEEVRSMQDAQSERLTRHIDSHWGR
jgi:hypothetical protein